jgi:hypothetical protein
VPVRVAAMQERPPWVSVSVYIVSLIADVNPALNALSILRPPVLCDLGSPTRHLTAYVIQFLPKVILVIYEVAPRIRPLLCYATRGSDNGAHRHEPPPRQLLKADCGG